MHPYPNSFPRLHITKQILFLGMGMLAVSCAESPDHQGHYGLFGELEPGIDIYVNGNPTDEGQKLSLFVVQGDNRVDLRGPFNHRGFALTILKTNNLLNVEGKTVTSVERNLREANENSSFSFQEPKWWRWAWQGQWR